MAKGVMISKVSKNIMLQLNAAIDDVTLREWSTRTNNEYSWSEVVSWLKQPNVSNHKKRFLLEALRMALLEDIGNSLAHASGQVDKNKTKPLGWLDKLKLKLLIAAGALLALSGGYSGITSLLLTFAAPMFVVVGAGFC